MARLVPKYTTYIRTGRRYFPHQAVARLPSNRCRHFRAFSDACPVPLDGVRYTCLSQFTLVNIERVSSLVYSIQLTERAMDGLANYPDEKKVKGVGLGAVCRTEGLALQQMLEDPCKISRSCP